MANLAPARQLELEDIDVSVRTRNCLRREGVATIRQLASLSEAEVLRWYGAGRMVLRELSEVLANGSLRFGSDEHEYQASTFVGSSSTSVEQSRGEQQERRVEPFSLLRANEEVQAHLISRLSDFSLSTRAINAVRYAKLLYVGDLVQLHEYELFKLPSTGRKTVKELSTLARSLGFSLGLPIADWSPGVVSRLQESFRSRIEMNRAERSARILSSIAPEPNYLEAELRRIAQGVENERNVELLLKVWGWEGDPPRTLDSVGKEFNLTRERVRQIETKSRRHLSNFSFDAPVVRRSIEAISSYLPDRPGILSDRLLALGLTRKRFSFRGLESAAAILNKSWPISSLADQFGIEICVDAKEQDRWSDVCSIIRKRTSDAGCVNLLALTNEAGLGEDVQRMRLFVDCLVNIHWLDQEKSWFLYGGGSRNRLYNICAKILSVSPMIRLPELRRALSRSRRLALIPPRRVLGSFIERAELGTINQEDVISEASNIVPIESESVEARILRILDEHGPIVDGDELIERCIEAGINAITANIYKFSSPVICSLGKGLYCKVGANIAPGEVEAIIARRKKKNPRIADHGWTSAGRLWFSTELSRNIIVSGSIVLKPFVAELTQGEWQMRLSDDTIYGSVICRERFIWSFRKALLFLCAEPKDFMTMEFDKRTKIVRVRIGGPDIVEEIQFADSKELSKTSDE